MARFHNLTVAESVQETADAHSILFDIPASLADKFSYHPGQFITLRFAYEDRPLQRCYSMSSTPGLDQHLRVTVKRVDGGRGSNWICDNLKAGSKVDVMQPAGLFVTKDLAEDHLLFAGGSGITPVLSILRHVLSHGTGKVRLVYANRDEASVIFKQTLKALAQEYSDRMELIHLLDSLQGIPSKGLLVSMAKGMQKGRAFICGPGPFMDAVEAALKVAGMPKNKVQIERFVMSKSAKDEQDPTQINQTIDANHSSDDAVYVNSTVKLEIDGAHHVIPCKPGQTVLDAAEDLGIELPYSCREGMCASCMCEVIEGSAKMINNDVLDEKDIGNNLILSCQAVPLTKELTIKYT